MTHKGKASAFAAYPEKLTETLASVLDGTFIHPEQLAASLDGQAAHEVRKLLPISYRREVGVFFTTGRILTAYSKALGDIPATQYFDPACGAGDLLLAASSLLPLGQSLADTIRQWGSQLSGCDLHQEFVDTTRLRLILAAAERHLARGEDLTKARLIPEQAFLGVTAGDGLERLKGPVQERAVILLNPPYGTTRAPTTCKWSTGSTSRAALFAEAALRALRSDAYLLALLPDVLRSGARYHGWRKVVEASSDVIAVERLGLFDKHADVDVFLLGAHGRPLGPPDHPIAWWSSHAVPRRTVGDYFDIWVGPVVDNRDPHTGAAHPFLIARDLPRTGIVGAPSRTRRFDKRLFAPPFVVFRRTSRPSSGGRPRAAGVLVTGSEMIAVDNHLILALPRDHSITTCRELLRLFQQCQITHILDERIRCRHLTVDSIKSLPWLPA